MIRVGPAVELFSRAALVLLLLTACCGKQSPDPSKVPPPRPAGSTLLSLPHVTLVAVTDWEAVLKPCGCTVDLQKGGIERITKYVEDLRQGDRSVLVVHAGPLLADEEAVSSPARRAQHELRMEAFALALERLGVAAVALSSEDLAKVGAAGRKLLQDGKWPVLSAGWQDDVPRTRQSLLVKTDSGVQVGLVGIDPKGGGDDATRHARVQSEVKALRDKGAAVVVVLSNLGLRGARKLARAVPGIDAIVVGGLEPKVEPVADLEREGQTLLVHATRQGAYLSALTLVPDGQGAWQDVTPYLPGIAQDLQARIAQLDKQLAEWRAKGLASTQQALPFFEKQRAEMQERLALAGQVAGKTPPPGRLAAYRSVGLTWDAPTDPETSKIVQNYDARVADLAEKSAGDVPPVPPGGAAYVGQAACLTCHQKAKDFADKDLHGHAWRTLEKGGKTRDLDCVPCHVTAYGQPGGSVLGKLQRFEAVQCEACHGPGSLHLEKPAGGDKSRLVNAPDARVCATCHTPQHSPRFQFSQWVARLRVPGHGMPVGPPK